MPSLDSARPRTTDSYAGWPARQNVEGGLDGRAIGSVPIRSPAGPMGGDGGVADSIVDATTTPAAANLGASAIAGILWTTISPTAAFAFLAA